MTSFRRTVTQTTALQGLALIGMIAHTTIAARWLGPELRGVQALMLITAQLITQLVHLGLPGATTALVGADRAKLGAAIRLQQKLMLFAPVLVLGVALLFRTTVGPATAGDWGHVLVYVEVAMMYAFVIGTSLGLHDALTMNLASLIPWPVSVAMLVVIHRIGTLDAAKTLDSLTAGLICGVALGTIRLWRGRSVAGKMDSRDAVRSTREFIRPGLLGLSSALMTTLMVRGDQYLVSHIAGFAASGIYSIAVFGSELSVRIPTWASTVLTARVAQNHNAGRRQTVSLLWMSVGIVAVCGVIAITLRAPLERVLSMLLGYAYLPSYAIALLLIPRAFLLAATAVLAANLAGHGYTRFHPIASFVGLVCTWAADLLLLPRLGLAGATAGGAIGYLAAFAIFVYGYLTINGQSVRAFWAESATSSVEEPHRALIRYSNHSMVRRF
jgi:O-antigen/teichoic acid export membrane protein